MNDHSHQSTALGSAAEEILNVLPDLGLSESNSKLVSKQCGWIVENPGRYTKDKVSQVFNTLKGSKNARAMELADSLLQALQEKDEAPGRITGPQLHEGSLQCPPSGKDVQSPSEEVVSTMQADLDEQPTVRLVDVDEPKGEVVPARTPGGNDGNGWNPLTSGSDKPKTGDAQQSQVHATAAREETRPAVTTDDESPVEVRIGEYKEAGPFIDLLGVDENSMPLIVDEMKNRGFDRAEPLTIWKEKNVLIDGYQRSKAAAEAGLTHVWAMYKSFPDEAAALAYAIKRQTHRRNADDATLMKLMTVFDQRKPQGGDRRSKAARINAPSDAAGRSADKTARDLGTSKTKIDKLRTILDAGDEQIVNAVKAGRITANAAYNKIRATKKSNREKTPAPTPAKAARKLARVSEKIEPIATEVRVFDAALADAVSSAGQGLADLSGRIAQINSEDAA